MKAITIKQPWASLIVEGIKDIENRTWPCPPKYIGHRVLIHSSAKPVKYDGLGDILTTNQYNSLNRNFEPFMFSYLGFIIGSVEIVGCTINHPSVWAEKSVETKDVKGNIVGGFVTYNWVISNPIKFPEPIPAKGKLSFWDYPNILAEPEEKNGELFCHCNIHIDEKIQVMALAGDYTCRYCGGRWYK